MNTSIQLGAELDIVTPGELDGALDDLHGKWRKDLETWDTEHTFQKLTLGNSGVWLAGQPTPFILGANNPPSPPEGSIWQVTSCTVTAGDDHTANAATYGLYIGGMPAVGAPNPLDCLVPGLTIPGVQLFSDKQVIVYPLEQIFVSINAPVNLVNYTVALRVLQRRDSRLISRGIR